MSAGAYPASAAAGRAGNHRRTSSALIRWAGGASLAAAVAGSLWLAAAAAGGRYLLELPTTVQRPGWIQGPLHALGLTLGSSGPDSTSVAVLVLACAYLVALRCADSLSLRLVLAVVALANLAFTLGPSIVSSDVFGYIAYAREAAHGLNPYVAPPSALGHGQLLQLVYWKQQTSPYGPLFTGLSVPLGLLPTAAAYWVCKATAGVAAVALALMAANYSGRRGSNPARAAIFVGLNPVLLLYAVSGAHNDLFATMLVVGGITLVWQGRDALGAGAVVAAAAIKLTLGLALPFVLIAAQRRRAATKGAAIAVIVLGVPTVLLAGPHIFDQLQRIVTDPRFDIAFSGPDRLASLLGSSIDGPVRSLCTILAAAVALVMLVRALRGSEVIAAAGWAFLALMASIASFAPWYLVWLLPLAALGRSRALSIATITATLYILAVHLPALGGQPWLSGPGGG